MCTRSGFGFRTGRTTAPKYLFPMTAECSDPPRRVCLISLGCPKNLVDSETMLGSLPPEKFAVTTRMEEADIVIVNTCAFLRSARKESREMIQRARRWRRPGKILVVAGCLVQYYGRSARAALPEADLLLGVGEGTSLERLLESAAAEREEAVRVQYRPIPQFSFDSVSRRLVSTPRHWAYLRISDGCDNRCSYCLIPSLRGPYRERPLSRVVAEAERLARSGVRELVLIAQDTARYGFSFPGRGGIPRLLDELSGISGIDWIRILYAHPRHIDEQLMRAVAAQEKVCPYLDIPVQHINDGILERMGRKIGARGIRDLLARARELISGLSLRTTLMVGFPGEGESEFEELVDFIRREQFDHLGIFVYSREKGTRAYRYGSPPPAAEGQRRRQILMDIQRDISAGNLRRRCGRLEEVLIDGPFPGKETNLMVGRGRFQAPEIDGLVVVAGEGMAAGDMVRVRLTESSQYDLYGVRVD